MKVYTRGGDGGLTTLLGGRRVGKQDARVEAYGTVDELSAAVGLAAIAFEAEAPRGKGPAAAKELRLIQADLFVIGARLAAANPQRALRTGAAPALDAGRIAMMEGWIDQMEAGLQPLKAFILPGGTRAASQLHFARVVCRRAERRVAALLPDQPDLASEVIPYLNRLSDLLFTLARGANMLAGVAETEWRPRSGKTP